MTLLKDLINIPESLQKGDFVLNLAQVAIAPDQTLRDYVVTPELAKCFDNALDFIRSTLQNNISKATYLHGSFGSGKSHFMAILYLILQGNTTARRIPELAPAIVKHNEWVTGKKFLLVPYHAISSESMESCILGGYVDFVRRNHPEAPIPGVYLAEGLFRDAINLRNQMGDTAFFERLNEANTNSGWGEIATGWNGDHFDQAAIAPPNSEDRSRLIGDLIKTFFSSYSVQAKGEAFLSLDAGLSVISRHARDLGYDALILFLDELILWLASHANDLKFIHQEGQKLSKLVESQTPDRPIPIVSFVARQRDLSELLGNAVPGAERLNFSDALKHWEGRFHRIVLEDRNLPAIAQKRVLRPKNPAAQTEIDAAFEKTLSIREAAMNVLLTRDGDRGMFRDVYPFSPALIQALIAVSSVLQRERTALKIMVQMLVERRDYLAVGDILPVGDLFDAIAQGDEAFSPETAIHFDNAKRLYQHKLLPMLEKQHGMRLDSYDLLPPQSDPKRIALMNDDRLIKTLLLSALVPEVEVLRALTPERLAALNHGTIKSPIAGREGHEVLRRCRQWAGTVGELRVGDGETPIISVQLSGVDTESIIDQGRREDNHGNRVRLVRDLLFEQIGIQGETEIEQTFSLLWKNTKRSCQVLFRNIREQPLTNFENEGDRWKIIIDYPFDIENHGPKDDISRIQEFSNDSPDGAKTLCWIPAFLSDEALIDLGTLVTLDHILGGTGDRFTQFASNLSVKDRQVAKSLLENQRNSLRQRILNHLQVVYGLDSSSNSAIDPARSLDLNERFQSLYGGLQLQPPVASNLRGALTSLLEQALNHEFPAAPTFEAEIESSNNLEKVYRIVLDATQQADGRIAVEDKKLRLLVRQIANPLLLGEMALDATHFVLGQHWKQYLNRKSKEAGGVISAKQLRRWIDEPKSMGLPDIAQNLVILIFASQTNRLAYRSNIAIEVNLKSLPDDIEFREQTLPEDSLWQIAVSRADSIFSLSVSPLLNAKNVAALSEQIAPLAKNNVPNAQKYVELLTTALDRFGIDKNCDRLKTAQSTLDAINRLSSSKPEDIINILAQLAIATSEAAMQQCFKSLKTLCDLLERANWDTISTIQELNEPYLTEAQTLIASLSETISCDEHILALSPVLKKSVTQADLLIKTALRAKSTPLPLPPPPTITSPSSAADRKGEYVATTKQTFNLPITNIQIPVSLPQLGKKIIHEETHTNLDLTQAAKLINNLQKHSKDGQQTRINLQWTIEEENTES